MESSGIGAETRRLGLRKKRKVPFWGKRFLVSSAAGFLGSDLMERRFRGAAGVTVIGIDKMQGCYAPDLRGSAPVHQYTFLPGQRYVRKRMRNFEDLKIAVAGTGYVGLSIATLLSQHHKVTAVDIVPEKVELINNRKSPIQDEYIEKYLAGKELDLTATLDAREAYSDADFVVIAAPTNVYPKFSVEF